METPDGGPIFARKMKMHRVSFIVDTEVSAIEMLSLQVNALCAAAQTLRASSFVAPEGGKWSVFTMRGADRNGGGRGEWSVRDPVRVLDTEDAAVMWALMRGRTI